MPMKTCLFCFLVVVGGFVAMVWYEQRELEHAMRVETIRLGDASKPLSPEDAEHFLSLLCDNRSDMSRMQATCAARDQKRLKEARH